MPAPTVNRGLSVSQCAIVPVRQGRTETQNHRGLRFGSSEENPYPSTPMHGSLPAPTKNESSPVTPGICSYPRCASLPSPLQTTSLLVRSQARRCRRCYKRSRFSFHRRRICSRAIRDVLYISPRKTAPAPEGTEAVGCRAQCWLELVDLWAGILKIGQGISHRTVRE